MTALENILNYYNHLLADSTSKSVLRHCLIHISQLKGCTIYELANLCYTSPPTISRLVKSLGYPSYSAFQRSIAADLAHYDYHNRFSAEGLSATISPEQMVLEHMSYIMEEFHRNVRPEAYMPIVDALHQAKTVVIFSYGIYFMECALQSDLIISGKFCDIVSGDLPQRQQTQKLMPGDLALFMCPDAIDATDSLRQTIEMAKQQGATICALSSTGRQGFLSLADITMSFSGHHYMVDSVYLELLLAVISTAYRRKYLDVPPDSQASL